jgi:ribosomal-protein-serine acetyltransferase
MLDDFNSLSIPGARIVLRSVDLRDVDAIFRIICNSREHLEKWLPWVDFVQTIDDERHIVEQWIYDMQMRAAIHLCITFENEIVGLISTHQIDWVNQRTSIGYWIGRESTGKNFATEATAVLITYLFDTLKVHRIYIQAATGNAASNRVIEKLGFIWEGLLRENERVKNSFLDHNIYAMTSSDFKRLDKVFSPHVRK